MEGSEKREASRLSAMRKYSSEEGMGRARPMLGAMEVLGRSGFNSGYTVTVHSYLYSVP